jgi:ribose 5-phosphate isomerase A
VTAEERVARLAECAALEVEPGMRVGLGSGSTAEAVVRALGHRVVGGLHFTGVPTSNRTATLARSLAISLVELDEVEALDLGIDGADEIDPALNLVKGRGGALLWEKLVARSCRRFLVVATTEKLVERLGTRMLLPVEIVPFGWRHTARRIEALGLTPKLRESDAGEPFHTDEGNVILDCATGRIADPAALDAALKRITGVVDHGLFVGIGTAAMVVDAAGDVATLTPRQ